jgi:hypothetical protein
MKQKRARIAQFARASSGKSVERVKEKGGAQIPASPNPRSVGEIVRRVLLRPIRRRGTQFGINPRDFLLRAPLYLAANIELTHTLRNTMQANTSFIGQRTTYILFNALRAELS